MPGAGCLAGGDGPLRRLGGKSNATGRRFAAAHGHSAVAVAGVELGTGQRPICSLSYFTAAARGDLPGARPLAARCLLPAPYLLPPTRHHCPDDHLRLPPKRTVQANMSAITGSGPYASTTDPWPPGHKGFRALVTDGWYLDSAAGGPDVWRAPYTREPLTNKTCTYSADFPRGNCSCTCPEGPWRDGECHCFDLRFDAPQQARNSLCALLRSKLFAHLVSYFAVATALVLSMDGQTI